jgi:prevent-host-death family protein
MSITVVDRHRPVLIDGWQFFDVGDHRVDADLTTWSGLVRLDAEAGMPVTNISEAKAQLSALIERVLTGEEIIIGKAGKPVARLVKYERPTGPRQPGALRGRILIAEDFDVLPDDLQDAFGMSGS